MGGAGSQGAEFSVRTRSTERTDRTCAKWCQDRAGSSGTESAERESHVQDRDSRFGIVATILSALSIDTGMGRRHFRKTVLLHVRTSAECTDNSECRYFWWNHRPICRDWTTSGRCSRSGGRWLCSGQNPAVCTFWPRKIHQSCAVALLPNPRSSHRPAAPRSKSCTSFGTPKRREQSFRRRTGGRAHSAAASG